MSNTWNKSVSQILLNRYVIATILFIIWMMFFDRNKWPVQHKLKKVKNHLEEESKEYERKIIQAKDDKVDLESNLEKYAREKYYMHKSNEEVFIIDKQEKKENIDERSSK